MPETETTGSAKSSDEGRRKKAKAGAGRELAARAERSLKDVDRLLRKSPEAAPHEKAMAQLEQAKILALLHLAESIRESRKAASLPT